MKNLLKYTANTSQICQFAFVNHSFNCVLRVSNPIQVKRNDFHTSFVFKNQSSNETVVTPATPVSPASPVSPVSANPVQTKIVSPSVNLSSVSTPQSPVSANVQAPTNTQGTDFAISNRESIQQFIDHTLYNGKPLEETGRAWDLNELRRKSFDDLHRLYFVIIKERNMLQTAKAFYKFYGKMFEHNERILNCKKSMQRIKQVIKEREELAREMAWEEFVQKRDSGKYVWPIDLNDDQVQKIVEKYDLWTLRQGEN